MKKIFCFFIVLLGVSTYAQTTNPIGSGNNLSSKRYVDNIFDHYGNKYSLADVKIEAVKYAKTTNATLGTSTTPLHCGYFDLYLEDGCGLNTTDTDYINRRNVITRVFTDLSNFITSDLTLNGKKVNIWVRNMANMSGVPSDVAGVASSFYNVPKNTTSGFGGIVDGEIWKTIHLGEDSYKNVASPLVVNPSNSSTSATGIFYHGMVAFRFDGSVNWNTNLSATTITNSDLYSVALHEITHALGFASLIGSTGSSKLGAGFNYYTRYDLKLKNSANTNRLISNTGACSPMYNYIFNSTTLTAATCSNSIKYAGTSTVTAYTPSTFSDGSSLSHFDSACTAGSFVMNSSTGQGVMRRFYTVQEKNALVEMGYTVNTSFGVSTTYNGTATYTAPLAGITVAGINDGIGTNGVFSYVYTIGSTSPLTINSSTNSLIRILANDKNVTGFECLQDVTDLTSTTTISASSGTATTNVTFTSSVEGLHLLRYVPINGTGASAKRGNITYIYVYVEEANSCAVVTACDLVMNGNFEQNNGMIPTDYGQISKACGWYIPTSGNPDYFHSDTTYSFIDIPCNLFGYQNDKVLNNKAYIGFGCHSTFSGVEIYNENVRTKLSSPLQINNSYQLSFDVSLAEGLSNYRTPIQAYLSDQKIQIAGYFIPIANQNMLFSSSIVNLSDGWQRIVFNIPSNQISGLQYLYIGSLNFIASSPLSNPNSDANCNYYHDTNNGSGGYSSSYYYIDNVSLIPLNGGSFVITPSSICTTQTLSDLTVFLSGLPANGVFSGTGVSYNSTTGKYSFSTTTASNGQNTISYTYTNSSSCSVTLYSNVVVLKDNPVITGPSISWINSSGTSLSQTFTTTIPSGVIANWSTTNGTITNPSSSICSVIWTSLPATLTLTFSSGSCTKSISKTIGQATTCDVMNANYFTYTQSGNTISNFQFFNSLSGISSGPNGGAYYGDGTFDLNPVSHTYTANGVYTIEMLFTAKQCSYLDAKTVTISSNKMAKMNNPVSKTIDLSEEIVVYPNPTNSIVNVDLSLNQKGIVNVAVKTLEGKLVTNENWNLEEGKQKIKFNLPSTISKGTYLIEIISDDTKTVKKLIIE